MKNNHSMNFEISDKVNTDKVFLVNKSKLEGRFEPEYYIPVLRKLENKVRKQSTHKLRDFIQGIAGGATPSTTQKDKYYTNEEGFPFLRVQNLQTNGKVNFDNLKYINEKTHNGLLKRSQVESGDLLIKITGVGRMAIACVAPAGFSGNTNQHMVVVKTGSREVSEYLANYLNLDLVEVLASRRATGATRPALDYQALKSIPIIEDLDFEVIEEAYSKKIQKEAEAKELLNSIDDYLLSELGIELPEKDNSLANRIFKTSFQGLSGKRFDPKFFHYDKIDLGNKFSSFKLKELVKIQKGQSLTSKEIEDGPYPVIAGGQTSPYRHDQYNQEGNVITISASGAYAGYAWYHKNPIFASDCSVISSKKENKLNTRFLYWVLNSIQEEIYKLQQGAAQPHVYPSDLKNIEIPLPALDKQKEILSEVKTRNSREKKLMQEAQQEVETARRQVEEMILEH